MILEHQLFQNITPDSYDLVSIKKFIEQCGRICYRSENLITQDSYIDFYDKAIKSKHFSILEHGTVYLTIKSCYLTAFELYLFYKDNKYSKVLLKGDDAFITTNFRVIVENNRYDDLRFMVAEPSHHERRRSVALRTSIQVYKELTRHRPASFCIESTRYCNYTSNKFDNNIRVLIPFWFTTQHLYSDPINDENIDSLKNAITEEEFAYIKDQLDTEKAYNTISKKFGPQAAAGVLTQNTMATVIITADVSTWNHIFALRVFNETGTAHPDTQAIMNEVYLNYTKRTLI